MKSPFPGMDPYLEGHLWPDVHHALAYKIRQQLSALIRPKYVARMNTYLVEDDNPEGDIGIVYPDVEVLLQKGNDVAKEPIRILVDDKNTPDDATITVPFNQPIEVKITTVEIRDTANNKLVTSIEILSPVNKRKPGYEAYMEKRRKLHKAGIHLLEIDLLRRGSRSISLTPSVQATDYLVALTRSESTFTDVWLIGLRHALPKVPVPLLSPDSDITLDLQQALNEVYQDAAYELSIDYRQAPPPPEIPTEDLTWINSLL